MKNFQQKPVDKSPPKKERKSAPVFKYMATELITFTPETEIEEVVEQLLLNRISGAPVLDRNRRVVGMIDDKTCLKVLFGDAYHEQPVRQSPVKLYMDDFMKSIPYTADIHDAANIFLSSTYKRLLVINEKGKLMGQISRRDILRAIKELDSDIW